MNSLLNALSSVFRGAPPSDIHTPSTSPVRRRQMLSSTDDAFSLPTHSPTLPSPSTAMQSPNSASYTYPPPAHGATSGTYDYVPFSTPSEATGSRGRTTNSSGNNNNPLLPVHQSHLSPNQPYPPLNQTWERLRNWLSNEYPELGDTLNYGIHPAALEQLEMAFGFTLPPAVRESYLVVDGQEVESSAGCTDGLFFGLALLPLEDALEEWGFWREVDDDPTTGGNVALRDGMHSIPAGWIRREYSSKGWIPLATDRTGNYLGVDLNPDTSGAVGQVIIFGRDFDTKVVLFRGEGEAGWARWLASFVDELESGEGFEVGVADNSSDDSEDGIGYESYFGAQSHGGGKGGVGALRLVGEYKGWNVLEALADRSFHRWREAGLVPISASPSTNEIDEPGRIGLGALGVGTGLGSEVHIPVVAEADVAGPSGSGSGPEFATTSTAAPIARPPPPTISITVPPPAPLSLPTFKDILASPSSSAPPSPASEIGSGVSLRTFARENSMDSNTGGPLSYGSQSVVEEIPLVTPSPATPATAPSASATPSADTPTATLTHEAMLPAERTSSESRSLLTDPTSPTTPTSAKSPSSPPSKSKKRGSTDRKVSPPKAKELATKPLPKDPVSSESEDGVVIEKEDAEGAENQRPRSRLRLGGSSSLDLSSSVSDLHSREGASSPIGGSRRGGKDSPSGERKDKEKKKVFDNFKRFSANLSGGKRKKHDSTSTVV
ncbi:hypothetical protein BOTBODRAFT_135508 [Botryobasidium botryosum FD-172 SS1]|uniref:Knr4/Smi1-like domain-containing protein n=1 Tax=Botryobasidium botryosum (strain FD-172 SS1) TaxID=930990 RepID=A0A067M7F0_BOTB1|nr:hypothetical protein BOTBODRAFT_135508 [Botryobasidium botryosum FD-172 SS1]